MSARKERTRILQIIPSGGWMIRTRDRDDGKVYLDPVIAWALVEEPFFNEDPIYSLQPMVQVDDTYADLASHIGNFEAVEPPGTTVADAQARSDAAKVRSDEVRAEIRARKLKAVPPVEEPKP